ncbi:MAG: DUF222 domain-containing protein [Actinomycetota bacterium]|nr:DUF222 domain-containing protein [Actinomycetota bacterium]
MSNGGIWPGGNASLEERRTECSLSELKRSLIAGRRSIDRAEARWLTELEAFDRRCGFALDGHLSTVAWLTDKCGMCRSTAKERLRVARALPGRPKVAVAMAAGEVSYSKARAITRIADADAETDDALLAAAAVGTAADLDRLASHWERLRDQDLPPHVLWERRGLRQQRRPDGLVEIGIVLSAEDAERFLRVIDLFVEHLAKRSSATTVDGERASAEAPGVAVGEDEVTDRPEEASAEAPADGGTRPTWSKRRADAVVDLIELALGRFEDEVDPERAQVDVIVDYETLVDPAGGTAEVAPGRPVAGETDRRLACDAGITRIITRGRSEVLDVGRRSRHWNRAQRRAIRYRHGHHCAIRGCERTILQIHHLDWWEHGGRTDLDLGVPLCHGHHRLVHEGGWEVTLSEDRTTATLRRAERPSPPVRAATPRRRRPNGARARRLVGR